MKYEVTLEGRTAQVSIDVHPKGGWLVRVDDGPEQHITGSKLGATEWLLSMSEGRRAVGATCSGDVVDMVVDHQPLRATVVDPREAALSFSDAGGEGAVVTPMPGVIVRVPVTAGDAVKAGQVVVVVEAMKMENEFKSSIDGIVDSIDVQPGDAVEANTLLVRISPA